MEVVSSNLIATLSVLSDRHMQRTKLIAQITFPRQQQPSGYGHQTADENDEALAALILHTLLYLRQQRGYKTPDSRKYTSQLNNQFWAEF